MLSVLGGPAAGTIRAAIARSGATKELVGHTHIGVTATGYAHVRLRLQRDAIDLLGRTLGRPSETAPDPDDSDEPPLCAAPVR